MIKGVSKVLFVLGLIILPINFSSAGYGDIQVFNQGVEYDIIGGGNSFVFQGNFNFLLDGQYKAFFWDRYRPYVDRHSMQWLFWHNGELYFMQNERNTNNIDLQGYIKSLHKCSYGYDPTDGTQNCSTLGTGDFYVSKYSNPDAFRKVSSDYEFACFDYDDLNESICITTTYADNFYNSLGFTYFPSLSELGTSVDQISRYFGTSYFGPVPNEPLPDYTINPSKPITNQDALEGCIYAGLDLPYCFGGFDIDNIFQPGEDYEAFTGYHFGSGAAIWSLYDLYSGAYSTPKNFMGSLRSAYLNKQFNRFYTEPKALFMIVHQYYSMYDRGQINFQWSDVWDFCDLTYKLSKGDLQLTDEYLGGNNTCTNGYISKKTNESQGSFQLSGFLNSGTGEVSSADEFFGRLTNLMNENISRFEGDFDPIIPSYIIVFMLAIILIRLISH